MLYYICVQVKKKVYNLKGKKKKMNDYDTEIVITSVMKFTSKKTQKPMVKLDLLFTDPKLTGANDKFVGCSPVTQFFDGHDVFDIVVSNGLILKGSVGHFITRKDYKDPTKTTSRLESIKYKDNVITLLQSDK